MKIQCLIFCLTTFFVQLKRNLNKNKEITGGKIEQHIPSQTKLFGEPESKGNCILKKVDDKWVDQCGISSLNSDDLFKEIQSSKGTTMRVVEIEKNSIKTLFLSVIIKTILKSQDSERKFFFPIPAQTDGNPFKELKKFVGEAMVVIDAKKNTEFNYDLTSLQNNKLVDNPPQAGS